MKPRAIAALLAVGCLLLGGCQTVGSPDRTPTTTTAPSAPTEPTAPSVAALCFCRTDSLNPYLATTRVNRDLTPLLYEGLTVIRSDRTVEMGLAASVTQTDATHLTVTLREGAVFSDNTPVTPDDVIASFAAAASSGEYRVLVQNISRIAKNGNTLTVTLREADTVLSMAALSFPVLRKNGNSVLGSGPYRLEGETLTDNPHDRETPKTPVWKLVDVTDRREMRYALAAGQIALYATDLTDSTPPTLSGNTRRTLLGLSHLLFLGIGTGNAALRDPVFRQGISEAIGRETLASHAFSGYATPAVNPFLPAADPSGTLAKTEIHENPSQTLAKWQSLGYNVLDNKNGKALPSLTLLVSADNAFHLSAAALVQSQLAKAGLTVTVSAVSAADLRTAVKNGRFDLYLGEVRLSDDGSLRPWMTAAGAASGGISREAMTAYGRYLAGETSAADYSRAFLESLPFIPLVWRTGAIMSAAAWQGPADGPAYYQQLSQWTM